MQGARRTDSMARRALQHLPRGPDRKQCAGQVSGAGMSPNCQRAWGDGGSKVTAEMRAGWVGKLEPPRVTGPSVFKPPLAPPPHTRTSCHLQQRAWSLSFWQLTQLCELDAPSALPPTRPQGVPSRESGARFTPHRPAAPGPGHASVRHTHLRPWSSSKPA